MTKQAFSVKMRLLNSDKLRRQLRLITFTPRNKQRYLYYLGRESIKKARQRLREQRDVEGKPFAPRKRKKIGGSQRMLKRMAKGKLLGVWSSPEKVSVGYFNSVTGKIAYKHQYGVTTKWPPGSQAEGNQTKEQSREKDKKKRNSRTRKKISNGCSEAQAEALLHVGFRRRQNGKLRKVSKPWIMRNITAAQAGLILESMGYRSRANNQNKKSWKLPLPARSFLGLNQEDRKEAGKIALDRVLGQVRRHK